jgi:hypothetical protein
MRRRSLLAAFVAGALAAELWTVVVLGAPAGPMTVEISVIHATRSDGGASIDPQLRDLPQLTNQQPFVRYNVFKLLDRKALPFEKGRPAVYGLVDGRTLQVTLVDVADGDAQPRTRGDQASKGRYHLRAEIAGPGKREFLKLLEVTAGADEPFFVGGQSYKGGTLFLELVVR